MTSNPSSLYQGDSIDLVAVWLVLWRYKLVVILVASIAVGATVWLAMTITPIYRAEVVVVPTRDSGAADASSLASRLGGLAGLAGLNVGASSGTASDALAVLRSRHLAEQFIDRNDLVDDLLADNSSSSLWAAVDRFRRTIVSIVTDNERGTTTIAINWRDPAVAAQWASQFVALANELIRARALDDSSRNIDYLNKQLEQTNVVELRRALYNLIESEMQKMMLANARVEYAFTVVDPSVAPESRISPRRTLMVLTAAAVGLLLGAAVALVINAVAGYRRQGNPSRAVQGA